MDKRMYSVKIGFLGFILLLVLCACSGGNKNSIIGQWEDENDIIQFNADGTFESPYYWLGGNYIVKDNSLTLSTMLGKEVYDMEIKDNTLYLYDSGDLYYKFTKYVEKSAPAQAPAQSPEEPSDNHEEYADNVTPESQENDDGHNFPKLELPLVVEDNLVTATFTVNKDSAARSIYADNDTVVLDTRSIEMIKFNSFTVDETHFFISNDDTLWGYGNNRYGQLGDNTGVDHDSSNLAKITDDVANMYILDEKLVLITKNDKTLWGWGTGMTKILPELAEDKLYAPAKILDDVVEVIKTEYTCFFLQSDGTVWTWATMSEVNDFDSGEGPGLRPIMKSVKEFYYEGSTYYAVRSDNSLWYWRYFASEFEGRAEPEFKLLLENIEETYLHPEYGMALTQDKVLYEWKSGYKGYELIERISDVRDAYALGSVYNYSECFSFAIKNDNTLWGWGFNKNGELGDGSKITRSEPVKIADNVKSLVADWAFLSMDGEVYCWTGENITPALAYTGVKEVLDVDGGYKCLFYDTGRLEVGWFHREGFEKRSSGEEVITYSLDGIKRVVHNRETLCYEGFDGSWYYQRTGQSLLGGEGLIRIEGGINFPE